MRGKANEGQSAPNGLLTNAFAVLAAQVLLVRLLGYEVISSLLIFVFDPNYPGIFERDTAYGRLEGIGGIRVFLATGLLPGWQIFVAPIVVLYCLGWLYLCYRNRRFVLHLIFAERRLLLRLTYIVPSIFLVVSVMTLPTTILFDAAIYQYHPLRPVVASICAILAPIAFWIGVNRLGRTASSVQ